MMAEASQSVMPAPRGPEQTNENTSTDSNANDGSSHSAEGEELQRAQILAHARSVSTPPATPSITTDEIEVDITSNDISEHAPGLYVARAWIRPRSLTPQEIEQILLRLEVDLALALSKIRAKSYKKRRNEDRVMIDMRMAGTPARGTTKITLRPCIWIFCGSKWCRKIVERDVKALNWFGPHKVHLVLKGGPVFAADEESSAEGLDEAITGSSSPAEHSRDFPNAHNLELTSLLLGENDPAHTSTYTSLGPAYTVDGQSCSFTATGSHAPLESSMARYGSSRAYNPHPTTHATSSTGGHEDQNEYDVASVTSGSAPSYCGEVSGSVWNGSQSHGSAESSNPSGISHHTDVNNTIHRQVVANQRYELTCELRNLTGCPIVFPGDDEEGWMDHIESHLKGKFPAKLRCWFCNDHYFDARQTANGDVRYNFLLRMQHIRHHIVHEGFRPDQILNDGHVVQHLFDNKLIDRRTYDSILAPKTVPPLPSDQGKQKRQGHQSHHRSHYSHHSHLSLVVENVSGSGSHRRSDHRSDRHRSDHTKKGHERGHRSSHRRNNGAGDRSYEAKDMTRGQDYAHSFASLGLNESAPVAPYTDRPLHQPESIEDRIVKTEKSSKNNKLHNTRPVTNSAAPADRVDLRSDSIDSIGSKFHPCSNTIPLPRWPWKCTMQREEGT